MIFPCDNESIINIGKNHLYELKNINKISICVDVAS